MRKLSVRSQPFRYHGKSSKLVFIRSTLALKSESAGSRPDLNKDRRHPVSATKRLPSLLPPHPPHHCLISKCAVAKILCGR